MVNLINTSKMSDLTKIKNRNKNRCPNCDNKQLTKFYEVKKVPVQSCAVLSSRTAALNFPRRDITLAFCNKCGFITNTAYDPNIQTFSASYEDQQGFSSTFNAFAVNLAHKLIKKYDLYKKDIVEIGCGKGDFLLKLCELGNNRGVGIDPCYINARNKTEKAKSVVFIKDLYSERYSNYHSDLLCCRHTLEHINTSFEFIKTIRRSIGSNLDTIVFFEVPDTIRILRELSFCDIYYEHCSYFSPGSLARLFRSCSFSIIDLVKAYDDQYILIEAKPETMTDKTMHKLEENVEQLAADVKYFSHNIKNKLNQWKKYLMQIDADGKRVVIWGAGSKCVGFLTSIGCENQIDYVVDINQFLHGKFIPGVGKEIKEPDFLREYMPDTVIIMNPIYRNEIKQMLDNMGITTELISA